MIFIYGDSHGEFCFKNLRLPMCLELSTPRLCTVLESLE